MKSPEEKTARDVYRQVLRPLAGGLLGTVEGCYLCREYFDDTKRDKDYASEMAGTRKTCYNCPLFKTETKGCLNPEFVRINTDPAPEDYLAIMVYLFGFIKESQ